MMEGVVRPGRRRCDAERGGNVGLFQCIRSTGAKRSWARGRCTNLLCSRLERCRDSLLIRWPEVCSAYCRVFIVSRVHPAVAEVGDGAVMGLGDLGAVEELRTRRSRCRRRSAVGGSRRRRIRERACRRRWRDRIWQRQLIPGRNIHRRQRLSRDGHDGGMMDE
jgi:hypothetical protein